MHRRVLGVLAVAWIAAENVCKAISVAFTNLELLFFFVSWKDVKCLQGARRVLRVARELCAPWVGQSC